MRRVVPLIAVLLVVAFVGAQSGSAQTTTPTLSIAASVSPVTYGGTTRITGRLTGRDHGDRRITLLADGAPFGSFSTSAHARTTASGGYSFSERPLATSRFEVRARSTTSAIITVPVRFAVSLHVSDATPRSGQVVRFFGRACPAHDGLIVSIQRRGRRGYRTVRRTRLVPSTLCSVYSRRVRIGRDGRFRAVVAA